MKTKPDQKTTYLNTIHSLVMALHRRDALMLCPDLDPTGEEVDALAVTERLIKRTCSTMRRLEADKAFGMQALLGQDAPDVILSALSLLIGRVVNRTCAFRDVSDLAALAAGRDASDLLVVHESFVRGGLLRPHCAVSFRYASNTGELRASLKQSAFRVAVGLKSDDEFDTLAAAGVSLEPR